MKKTIAAATVYLALIFVFSSCKHGESVLHDTDSQTLQQTEQTDAETLLQMETPDPPMVHGIDIVDYPNPYAVSDYENLTDDQKVAYDALSSALKDISKNGPVADKSYSLSKRISWYDYATAYNLFNANFEVVSGIISSIKYNYISTSSVHTDCIVDSIYLSEVETDKLNEYYQEYLEINSEADKILASLDHDGTEYGKALAIATWMVDNIVYPADYEERRDDGLGGAYSAIMKKEAICGGYAQTFDFMCKKAGIETICVSGGTIRGGHAWNMIRIDGKWYHVDVTWMDNDGDFYGNFMVPDRICFSNGHLDASYYGNSKSEEAVIPTADSFDLCKYYYRTAEDAIRYFKSIELAENTVYRVVFDNEVEKDRFMKNNKCSISDSTGKSFVLNITSSDSVSFFVSFVSVDKYATP